MSTTTRIVTVLGAGAAVASGSSDRVPVAAAVAVAVMVPAALVDVVERRIPNALTAAAAVVIGVLLVVLWSSGLAAAVGSASIGAGMMAAPLLVAHLVSPGAMGLGDVKAAVVLGASVGVVEWQLALVALAVGAGGAAVVGLATRQRVVPFGPGLVGGALAALLFVEWIVPDGVAVLTTEVWVG